MGAKFQALCTLAGYGVSMFTNPIYAIVFDAKATSYWRMILPHMLSLACRLGEMTFMFAPMFGAWKACEASLQMLKEERLALEASTVTESKNEEPSETVMDDPS